LSKESDFFVINYYIEINNKMSELMILVIAIFIVVFN
jgi:hypothetical protein